MTTGLYGVIRHPQYAGIILALFGQIIHWPTIPTVLLFPFIVWAYVRLARKEERVLIREFGEAYQEYRRRVPKFFPPIAKLRRLIASASARAAADREEERRWSE